MKKEEFIVLSSKEQLNDKQKSIPLEEGMSLYRILQKEGVALSAPCAGNGTCGACKIKVLRGNLPITDKDKKFLSEEQLKSGWRLACQAFPSKTCEVFVPTEEYTAVTGYEDKEKKGMQTKTVFMKQQGADQSYAIAIDLGTTTLAYELFSLETQNTVNVLSSVNPQRIYGADVVSRMEQSNNGRKDMLKIILRQGMQKDIAELIKKIEPEKIQRIAISGNTAMIHLMMGYSCEGLGRYPFTPVTLDFIQTDAQSLGLMEQTVPVFVSPGISAYVGGDILMGLAAQNILEDKKPCLFLDLGTNAEMALTDGNGKIHVTSAPAGPAFEAANISCGVGSVEGAVSSICIKKGQAAVTTIGKKEAIGFCGSGILEAVYEFWKNHIIDETGLLIDDYFESGFSVGKLKITQTDIRQIQLAKSAVFSAITILMKRAGVKPQEIEKIYLAGGFGYYLNIEKAIGIGLLPRAFTGKIQTIGNSCLFGTKEYLLGHYTKDRIQKIKSFCEEIYLSNDSSFQTVFMENMNFN